MDSNTLLAIQQFVVEPYFEVVFNENVRCHSLFLAAEMLWLLLLRLCCLWLGPNVHLSADTYFLYEPALKMAVNENNSMSNEFRIVIFVVRASQLLRRTMYLWSHQQSIVASWAECKTSKSETGEICEDLTFFVVYGFVIIYVLS